MTADLLAGRWECTSTEPGALADPTGLSQQNPAWIAATVPGTAAGALRADGAWHWGEADSHVLDGRDWWFRCRFAEPADGPWLLHLRGLATIADVWLNGDHLLHSENMFIEHECEIDALESENELCIRFAALDPVLARRRPRPRWKSKLIRHQNLRWIRTALLGRIEGWAAWAAPVGPWRPVELVPRGAHRVVSSNIDARCEGRGGSVTVRATLAISGEQPTAARLRVGDTTAPLALSADGAHVHVEGTLQLAEVERWWPHTHGAQPRYPVALEIGATTIDLTPVGFRTVEVDRTDGGFRFVVNDTPIFCRGAVWIPPDVVSLNATPEQLRASLELLRDTGMNMVRIGGYGTYQAPAFWELCDELGVMVWQDCMLASFDLPDDDEFEATIAAEMTQVFTGLQGRAALAIVCGGSEQYQQAAMYGLEVGSWEHRILEETIPAIVNETVPGVPYIPSSPIGGQLPFEPSTGVSHYFGVSAYFRPLSDARLSDVRFASECLAFSIPPERATVDEMFGGSSVAGHAASWKLGVARDGGTSWDFEDVRDYYVQHLFGVDPLQARYADPEWALDLGRAAVAEAMTSVMTDWRRPGSRCGGGVVLTWRDLWPGGGWGLVDSLGRPKAPIYALRRVLDPLALLVTDEGLSGLLLHVMNDRPRPFVGRLELDVYADDGLRLEHAAQSIKVEARSALTTSATELLGGFRDLTRAFQFGPPAHDVVRATLVSDEDGSERETFYFPLGRGRPRRSDLDLTATMRPAGPGQWELTVASRLFAQWVAVDVPRCTPSDSWFHLAPGSERTILLRADDPDRTPRGDVRALNARGASSIRAGEDV